jgi:hypothetical protein
MPESASAAPGKLAKLLSKTVESMLDHVEQVLQAERAACEDASVAEQLQGIGERLPKGV